MTEPDKPKRPRPKLEPKVRDQELWQALGQLTVCYAQLEDQLQFNIWTMLHKDGSTALQEIDSQWVARIVLAHQPFKSLTDIFCSLCKLRHADPRRLELVRKDLVRVSDARNKYVHSHWDWGDKQGTVTRSRHTARAKDGLEFKDEQVTPADIRAVADDIGFVTLRVGGVFGPGYYHPGLWDDISKMTIFRVAPDRWAWECSTCGAKPPGLLRSQAAAKTDYEAHRREAHPEAPKQRGRPKKAT